MFFQIFVPIEYVEQYPLNAWFTGQQIRKYETGQNRMMPERIMTCAEIFNVPVGYFYGEGEKHVGYDKTSLTIASTINDIEDKNVKQALYYLALAIQKAYEG